MCQQRAHKKIWRCGENQNNKVSVIWLEKGGGKDQKTFKTNK